MPMIATRLVTNICHINLAAFQHATQFLCFFQRHKLNMLTIRHGYHFLPRVDVQLRTHQFGNNNLKFRKNGIWVEE